DVRGNIWITDFGLAKCEGAEDLSQSRDLVGTLRFMAPERFRGVSDRRGDIYALGATLYEMLALRPTFSARDHALLIEQVLPETPRPLRQIDRRIPRALETIVLRAMAKDPAERFQKAEDLADELRRFVDGRTIQSRRVSPLERAWRWCKREPITAG